MKDEEIIRVLNHIVGLYDKDLTTICGIRLVTLCGDALDLINRQKAEIEMLKADIENANKINFRVVSGLSAFAENIRAEVIKEFAERKKEMNFLIPDKENKKITNYDRIKSMSVEEMVDLLKNQVGCGSDFIPCGIVCSGNCTVTKTEDCKEKIKQWLLQEVSDENTV